MKHLLSLLTMALCLSCTARTAPSKMVSATASAAATPTARHFVITFAEGARLTAYLPAQPSGRAIVDLPGGGYSHLAVDHEGHQWADWMNRQGIAFFVLEYRMPKGDRTIPLTDAYRAMTTVRDSATAWRVNPYDVGIMGFSAGGHLASAVSTHAPWAARPNFSILFYPVVSMDERVTHKGSCANFLGAEGMKDQRLIQQWSNDACVRRHLTPPACVILSTDDRVVPPVTNGVAYYSAMRRAGNNCALYAYPSGGHGYGIRKNFAFHEQMLGDLKAWLATIAAPREQALRVACIGNSITDGMGIDMSEVYGYPAVLQRLLGKNYNVKNFGVSARTLMNKGDLPYMKEQAQHRGHQAGHQRLEGLQLDTWRRLWRRPAEDGRHAARPALETSDLCVQSHTGRPHLGHLRQRDRQWRDTRHQTGGEEKQARIHRPPHRIQAHRRPDAARWHTPHRQGSSPTGQDHRRAHPYPKMMICRISPLALDC